MFSSDSERPSEAQKRHDGFPYLIDLAFWRLRDHVPINCDHQTNKFERLICAADRSIWHGNRMITAVDKIARNAVTQDPIPLILAIGQSINAASQVRLRFWIRMR